MVTTAGVSRRLLGKLIARHNTLLDT